MQIEKNARNVWKCCLAFNFIIVVNTKACFGSPLCLSTTDAFNKYAKKSPKARHYCHGTRRLLTAMTFGSFHTRQPPFISVTKF